MKKRAFDFIPLNNKRGKIEIRGSYYSPVTYTYLKELLDITGEYIDGFKFVAGCQRLHTEQQIKQFTSLCKKNRVYVSTGGMIERAIVHGKKGVDKFLRDSKKLGFNVIEVSSGLANIPLEDKVKIVKQVKNIGMESKPEIGFMKGAGAGTKVSGYKPKLRSEKEFFQEADAYLKAGAKMLMFESEGVTEDLPVNKWRTDLIDKAVKRYGLDKWMFEAADPLVFKWFLNKYGKEVNLFIDHSQVFEFTAWRSGLWGDPGIWKGKTWRYK